MTQQQINWAQEHDWFICRAGNNSVTVRDYTSYGVAYARKFDDYAKLRAWAGY